MFRYDDHQHGQSPLKSWPRREFTNVGCAATLPPGRHQLKTITNECMKVDLILSAQFVKKGFWTRGIIMRISPINMELLKHLNANSVRRDSDIKKI